MAANYHPSLDDPNAWVPYRYIPSKAAAIVFVAAFGITTGLHIFQMCRRRTWYFTPLIVGGLFEVVGMIGRLLSNSDLWALGPYIMQSLLLLLAPALFAASIYIILGRIILLVDGERYSLIPHKWLTKTFVFGDVLSFTVQMAGGGIQAAGTLSLLHLGEKIIIVGLFIQLAFFGFFIVVAGLFHYRFVRAHGTEGSARRDRSYRRHTSSSATPFSSSYSSARSGVWRKHIRTLYMTSLLIMIRSIFRVIEYLMGNDGYLLRHEVFLYVFDATLMFFVMAIFNFIHPSQITELYQQRLKDQATENLELGMEMDEGRPYDGR